MIIFDLDGTLADCEHRRHFVTPPSETKNVFTDVIPYGNGCILTGHYEFQDGNRWKPDWKSFHESCDKDLPIEPVVEMWNNYEVSAAIGRADLVIWSGRCESVRSKTEEWIDQNLVILNLSNLTLKMRPVGDNTPDDQLKEKLLDEAISQGKTIEFVFESQPKSIDMWRRRGIFVFDVNQTGKEF